MPPHPLPLEETTPVTEAIENGVEEGVASLNDISLELQRTISLLTRKGAPGELVTQGSRLGVALLRGYVNAWATAIDGLGLIAADEVQWWWTAELTSGLKGLPRPAVVRASVTTVPQKVKVHPRLVRVARLVRGSAAFIDRLPGVPPGWDGRCFVAVRQQDDFVPRAVEVMLEMVDRSGRPLGPSTGPHQAVLTLPV